MIGTEKKREEKGFEVRKRNAREVTKANGKLRMNESPAIGKVSTVSKQRSNGRHESRR